MSLSVETILAMQRYSWPGNIRQLRNVIEWMMMIVDRVTHLSDAMRGFNQFAQDSGKKIQELRAAALGTFAPKLDEVVEFCTEVYRLWSWIYINMYPEDKIILQKEEDEQGEMNYSQFVPALGKMFKFYIDVSARSMIPDDPDEIFQEAVVLYNLGQKRTGLPMIPEEVVIDLAPNITEKHRIKKWLAQQQKQIADEANKEEMLKQFEAIGAQIEQVEPGSPEENQLLEQMIQIVDAVPEIWKAPQFQALSERVKTAIGEIIINGGMPNVSQ
jgi:transcriptional regulator with GAF, ATPase, and Fis domain